MINYPLYVTFDTNILDSNKYDFEPNSTLSLLEKYVSEGKIKVILSDIVVNEAKKHISEKVTYIIGQSRKLRGIFVSNISESLIKNIGLNEYVKIYTGPEKNQICKDAVNCFESYLKRIDAEILTCKTVNIETVLDDYFNCRPPFENNDKKKSEFPDAIMSLEIKNRIVNQKIAVISTDDGFKKSFGNEPNYMLFDSLGDLYDAINRQDEKIARLLVYLNKYEEAIKEKIENLIDEREVEVNGLSYDRKGVSYGYDYDDTELISHNIMSYKIHSVDSDDEDSFSVTMSVNCRFVFNCYYTDYENSPWDSEEKEYYYVIKKEFIEKHSANFPVLVSINLESEDNSIDFDKIILGGDSRISCEEVLSNSYEDQDEEIYGKYGNCPNCGDALNDDNSAGNGYCINCTQNGEI